jgi:threonine aldolase
MRYLAAQVVALGEGDLWLRNAQHANAMAQRLVTGMTAVPDIEITQSVDANAVFAMLPEGMTERLQQDFHFYVWNDTTGEVRLMTSWATAPEDVDACVAAMKG